MSTAYRSSATAVVNANGNTCTVTAPAGLVAGDFLIAHVSVHSGDVLAITAPTGWALLREDATAPDSSGTTGWIFTKTAGSSEPGSYTFSGFAFRAGAVGIVAYIGVKTASAIETSGVSTAMATVTPASPALATIFTVPRLLWFLAARENLSTDTATVPAGMTQRWRANTATTPSASLSLFADLVISGPATVPAKTGALSPAANTVTHSILLSPADENPNHPPIANAGPARGTVIGTGVTLDGSGSSDPDPGDTITYAWSHASGPNSAAQLSSSTAVSPIFTPTSSGIDVFSLTVTDNHGLSSSPSTVTVNVTPVGVTVSTASGNGTTMTAPIPSAAQAGDVAFFALNYPGNRGVADAVTSGWAALVLTAPANSSTDACLVVFAKTLTSSDLNTSVSASFASVFSANWTAQVVTVRGLNALAPYPSHIWTTPIPSPNNMIRTNIIGGAGTATYVYTVTSIDAAGERPPSGVTFTVTNAPNTLTSTNYVQIIWTPVFRATNFNVYGRTAGSQTLIGTVTSQTTGTAGPSSENEPGFSDKGTVPGAQVPPTTPPLGWLVDGLNLDPAPAPLPLPERLRTTFSGAKLLMFAGAQLNSPNTAVTVTDPGGVSGIATSTGPPGDLVLHSAIQTLGAAGDVGTRLFTPSQRGDSWATFAVILRTTGTNGTPTARAGFPQYAESGSKVTLNGGDSFDLDGDTLSYSWTQTGGTPVQLSGATSAFPTFVMPTGSVTVQLTVTDPSNVTGTDTVTITSVPAGQRKVKNSSGAWVHL